MFEGYTMKISDLLKEAVKRTLRENNHALGTYEGDFDSDFDPLDYAPSFGYFLSKIYKNPFIRAEETGFDFGEELTKNFLSNPNQEKILQQAIEYLKSSQEDIKDVGKIIKAYESSNTYEVIKLILIRFVMGNRRDRIGLNRQLSKLIEYVDQAFEDQGKELAIVTYDFYFNRKSVEKNPNSPNMDYDSSEYADYIQSKLWPNLIDNLSIGRNYK